MNSITDKISVKKFNDFLENEQTSRAFSRLAERKLNKNKTTSFLSASTATASTPIIQPIQLLQPKYYKYNRDELIEISRNPRSKMTKKEFIARLKNPDLDEKIILSFQRKEQTDPIDMNDNTGYRFPMKISSRNNSENPENGSNGGQNSNNNKNEKGYRFSKYDYDSNQSWRTDRFSQDSRGGKPSSNRSTRRMTKYNDMKRYDNGGRDFYNNEPEPEWFSDGPKSMTDFIDLKGFDDDCNNNDINNEETSSDSYENNIKKNDDLEKDSTFLFSDISKDDFSFSSFLDSTSEEFSHITGFEKSRSERWFKSRFSTSSQNQDHQEQTSTASCNSLIDLFQKQNIDINNFSYHNSPKIELSSAVNVSELEASFVDKDKSTDVNQPLKKEESSLQNNDDNDLAILSKLKFLANNTEQQQDDKQQATEDIDLDTRQFSPPQPPQMSAEMFKNYFLKFNNSSMAPMNPKFLTDAIHNNPFQMNASNIPRVPMFFPAQVPQPHNPFLRDPNNPHPMVPPMHIPHSHPFYMHRFLNSPMLLKNPHFINQPPPNMLLNFTQNMENPFAKVSGDGMKIQPQHFVPGNLSHLNNQFNEHPHPQQSNEQQLQQESSVAHKLLKNSKFTPTSVFRKLKDQSVNKQPQASTIVNNSPPPPAPPSSSSSSLNIQSNHNIDQNQSVESLQSFLKQLNLNQSSSNESSISMMPPLSSKLEPNSLSLSNTSKPNSEYSKSVDPNDIFNVFKAVNNNSSNNNPVISGVEFPPLPLMNALKVEDIEKS